MTSLQKDIDTWLRDPLSTATRNWRRLLLAASLLVLLAVFADIVPRQVPALEIDLSEQSRSVIIALLTGAVLYAMASFAIYALADWVSWRAAIARAAAGAESTLLAWRRVSDSDDPIDTYISQIDAETSRLTTLSKSAAAMRAVLEFLVPLVVATISAASGIAYCFSH